MSLTLKETITATQTTIDVNGTDTLTNGDLYAIEDEQVFIVTAATGDIQPGQTAWQRLNVQRGQLGTTEVGHTAGTAVTLVEIPLGSGLGGSSVTFADTDPGAIGARNFWLHTDPNNNATFLQLLVRNDADSGWRHVGWADNYEGALGTMQGQTYDNDGNVTGLFDMNAGSFTITGSGDPVGAGWWQGTVGVNSTSLYLNYLHNNGVNFEIALSTTGIRVTGLPTADPTVAGALWIDTAAGRVIKVSAG